MTTALNTTNQINDVGMGHKLTQLIAPDGTAVNVADIVGGNVSSGTFSGDVSSGGNLSVTGTATITGALTQTGQATFALMPRYPVSAATPAGTVVGNATAVVAGIVIAADAAANTGLVLPTAPVAGTEVLIVNNSGNTTKVYPDASATINAIGSHAAISLGTKVPALFVAASTTQWFTLPLVPS